MPAVTVVDTGKTEVPNGGEMGGQSNGGEMGQSNGGVQAPTLPATGVSAVTDARTRGCVEEAVFRGQGEHSVKRLNTDGGLGGPPAQPDTDCGTHTEANGGAGVQPVAAMEDTGGDVSTAASGASVLRSQPGSAMRDSSNEGEVDAHSARKLRVAVNTILIDAEAKAEANRRATQAGIARAATVQLQEVLSRVEVEETSLMAEQRSEPDPDHVAKVHRGAEAEAKEMAAAATDEAQMEAAIARSQMDAAIALSLESMVPDGQRMAQVKATEVAEHYEAQRETERTESARVEAEQLNARNAAGIAARAAGPSATQKAEQLLGPAGILEQERLLRQAAHAMKDREAVEHGLRRRQISTEDRAQPAAEQDQLARALAESQADAEEQKLAQEEEQRVIQAAIDETGLDAEAKKAGEDEVAAVMSESKRDADALEAIEREEAIRRTWSEDLETVVQMQAQVAGLPTQDTEVFKESIKGSGMEEFGTPSDGNCFYHVVEDSTEGSAVSLNMTVNELRKHSAAEAMKRREIDQEEAEQRSEPGRLVARGEIQAMATTLGCRIVIYHARPARGEPDKDIIEPWGRNAVRDICMVLRSAHYTVLLDPDCYQRKMAARQRRIIQGDMGRDKFRAGIRCETVNISSIVQEPTRRQAAPEIGPPNVWSQMVPKRGYTQVRCAATGAPLEPRRLEVSEIESLASGSPRHSGFAMRAVPTRAAGLGYGEESAYNRLTRRQRDEATRFTHQFDVVGVTTQPKGTGRSQGVEQVGSSGEAVSRGTTDGDEVHPFNQTALQMRSAERSRKAKAENELARQRRRGYGSSTDSTATTYQYTTSLPERSDVQQALRRGAATWAMTEVGQDPDEEFNGSSAQQMVQEQVESDVAEADGTDDRGIEGRDLVWWFNSWQHWQQDKDRKLSGCTDFDAMHFARTQRVCLGGAWGCVLARMQETTCDTQAVKMLRSTFRLASATCGRRTRTPGVTLFSGADAQQMAGSVSHSGSGAGSGTGGSAVGQTESATGEQPAPGEEAAAEQHGSDDNTSAVRREMNQTELSLARSQAVLIMHKLMRQTDKTCDTQPGE